MAPRNPGLNPNPTASGWKRWLSRWWPQPTTLRARAAAEDDPSPLEKQRPGRSRRAVRREELYTVVRENMIRAGVLSSSYKFKVLTLDHEGASHLVLIDIQTAALETVPDGTLELEAQLQQLAQERLQVEVKAVYWRLLGSQQTHKTPTRAPKPAPETRHDPVEHDELAALQRALGQRSPVKEHPGFEPTRPMTRRESDRFSPLSETQLGNLE